MNKKSLAKSSNSVSNSSTAWLVIFTACAYFSLWTYNSDILFEGAVTTFSAARWLIVAPAILLGVMAMFKPAFGVVGQVIFIVTITISVFTSHDPYSSLVLWARIMCPFGIVRGCALLNDDERYSLVKWLLGTLAFFVVISAFSGLTHVATFYQGADSNIEGARFRLTGLTFHPNMLGYCAAILLCFGLIKVFAQDASRKERIFWVAMMIVSTSDLIRADSRTGQLAAAIGIVGLVFKKYFGGLIPSKSAGVLISYLILVITLLALLAPLAVALDVVPTSIGTDRSQVSVLSRLALWATGWDYFLKYPIFGIGLGTKITIAITSTFKEQDLPYFHSALINSMATCGTIGAIGLIYLIFETEFVTLNHANPYVGGTREYRRENDIIYFAVTSMVVTLVFSITEGALQGYHPSYLFFFLATALLRKPLRSLRKSGPVRQPGRPLPNAGRPRPSQGHPAFGSGR
jgi:O-antigen ligase